MKGLLVMCVFILACVSETNARACNWGIPFGCKWKVGKTEASFQ